MRASMRRCAPSIGRCNSGLRRYVKPIAQSAPFFDAKIDASFLQKNRDYNFKSLKGGTNLPPLDLARNPQLYHPFQVPFINDINGSTMIAMRVLLTALTFAPGFAECSFGWPPTRVLETPSSE
jgi:hypothetical protein